jgi:AcrR family transcriptional regulator
MAATNPETTSDSPGQLRRPSRRTPDYDRVIKVVQQLLESGGESAVRIDSVCDLAEVSRSSLYSTYGNRDGLIAAARARQITDNNADLIAFTLEAIEGAHDAEDYRRRIFGVIAAVHAADRADNRVMRAGVIAGTVGQPDLARIVRNEMAELTDAIAEVVAVGQQRGFIDGRYDANLIALLLQVLGFGIVVGDFNEGFTDERRQRWLDLVSDLYDSVLHRVQ